MLNAEQMQKLASLLAQEHVAVVTTQGDEWPTATMQAFAETDTLEIILIMLESAPKFLNLRTFFMANTFYRFEFDDETVTIFADDQVWFPFTDIEPFVENWDHPLRFIGNAAQP